MDKQHASCGDIIWQDSPLFASNNDRTGRLITSSALKTTIMSSKSSSRQLVALVVVLLLLPNGGQGFSVPQSTSTRIPSAQSNNSGFTPSRLFSVAASATTSEGENTPSAAAKKAKAQKVRNAGKTLQELRQEGGPFTIATPIGALNPFALYYGLLSIFLGIPWLIALKTCQLLYFITGNRFDPKRRLPVFFSHVWGTLLMRLTRSFPEMDNLDVLQDFYKNDGRPAMFVANHCSWMDIPFLGATVGWRNYKLVSKKELAIIPILGSAIVAGGNILLDRSNRKSQLKTLKDGINYLKNGIHLCTFPEGTRSRTGRLLPFKNGAFKMAYKAQAPVIPISIVHSNEVMPPGWMFAMKPSYKNAKVVVHPPVESEGKTEEELAQAVRASMISGLPDDQKPLNG